MSGSVSTLSGPSDKAHSPRGYESPATAGRHRRNHGDFGSRTQGQALSQCRARYRRHGVQAVPEPVPGATACPAGRLTVATHPPRHWTAIDRRSASKSLLPQESLATAGQPGAHSREEVPLPPAPSPYERGQESRGLPESPRPRPVQPSGPSQCWHPDLFGTRRAVPPARRGRRPLQHPAEDLRHGRHRQGSN